MTKSDVDRIREMGHRAFVGGDGRFWEDNAKLQYDFMVSEGLKPEHVLLDVACGSLRAGRLFIKYLAPGNYLGLDKEIDLIIHGVAEELGIDGFVNKRPVFVISETFEFYKFSKQPDYILAQSLFTHLTPAGIYDCLKALRQFVSGKVVFYATFFETDSAYENPLESDSLDCFFYTREHLKTLADLSGWKMHYIGDWAHPRGQKIVKLETNF
jgi:SAM-dependent methyltransferase